MRLRRCLILLMAAPVLKNSIYRIIYKVTPAIGDMRASKLNLLQSVVTVFEGVFDSIAILHTLNIEHTDVRSIPNDIRRCTLKH